MCDTDRSDKRHSHTQQKPHAQSRDKREVTKGEFLPHFDNLGLKDCPLFARV